MKTKYEETKNSFGDTIILRFNEDGSVTSFGINPANSDYQAYLKDFDEADSL
jgi:hypothetical protein